MFTLSFCFFFEHESTESHSKLPFGKSKKYPLSMLITKFFDHYFQFILRFYIQG